MSFYKVFDKYGSNAIWMNWNNERSRWPNGQRLRCRHIGVGQFMSKS